ncbi:oligosaccharide flippase family protein [Streptococcus bovimastitidis]|uniref:oligosaccharide flippase family protein n=1 Tax=Streptococcus bovimastitidis TaxID=1856638 RepID=UPI0008FF6426|nr:oligosaccharide flippase family protein [Streptococcus bovimastitidis]
MPNKKKNLLLRNTIFLYVLMFTKMIFPMLTLPYLTRVLSIEHYGVVAYVKAYNSYIQLLLDFGFILSATKYIVKFTDDKEKLGKITGNVFAEKAILGLLGILSTVILANSIPILSNNQLFVWLFLISSLVTIFIPDFLFRGLEKMEYVTYPFVVSKTIVLALTFVLIKGNSDFLLIPILEIVGNSLAAVISIFFIYKQKIQIQFDDYRVWFSDIKESSVYFFSNFATTIFGALTTLIVGIYMGKVEIAYWSVCMQIVAAAKSMYNPIVNSIYPHMLKTLDWKLIKKLSKLFAIPITIGSLIVLFFGNTIMSIIGGSDFYAAGDVLKFLIPVFVVSFYSMLIGWPVLGARGLVKETTLTTVISAVIQVLGIVILIVFHKFELIALAICCDISEIYLLVSRMFYLRKL